MSKKYLDDTGLSHFWDKIKAKISGDISAEAGKMIPYGYCQTAKGTVAKTVTVSPAVTSLTTGLTIAVRFQYENTSSNPTLNVNGLGAKAIKRYGSTAPSTSATGSWNAGSVNILTYNGSYWMLCDWNNTSYSSMTVAEYEAGTGTTARIITPARLKDAIEHWATGEANVQSDWEQTDGTADDFIKNKPTIPTVPTNVSAFTNDAGFITSYTETDPIFTASPAHNITTQDITNWNNAKFRDNLLNTLDLVPYGQNVYREKGGVHLTYRDNDIDTWFRLNLSSPLKAGNTYTLSFDCEGVADGLEDKILFTVSNSTGSQISLHNGRITTTFVMTADKTDLITLDDNNTSSTRPSNTDIRLSNFLLEDGGTASQYKPSLNQISNTVGYLTSNNVAYLSASEWGVGITDGKFCNASRMVSKGWEKDSTYSSNLNDGFTASSLLYVAYPMPMKNAQLHIASDRRGEYMSYVNTAISGSDGQVGGTFRIISPYANATSGTTACRYQLSGLIADVPTTPTVAEDATIGQAIVDIAKTYTHAIEQGRNFYYGRNLFYLNGDVVNDSQGRGMMECDTFAGLCLRGIPYENSPYASASSNIYANDEPNKTMTYDQLMSSTASNLPNWAVALRQKFVDTKIVNIQTHEVRFASDYARLFWSMKGHIFSDINSVRKGDIAFWNTLGKPYFGGVTHVAIVGDNNDIYEVTGFERTNGRYLHNIKFENLVDHMPTYFARPYGFQ